MTDFDETIDVGVVHPNVLSRHDVSPLSDLAVSVQQTDGTTVEINIEGITLIYGESPKSIGNISRGKRFVRAGSALLVIHLFLRDLQIREYVENSQSQKK